jgi:hypothetical protein
MLAMALIDPAISPLAWREKHSQMFSCEQSLAGTNFSHHYG